MLKTLNVPTSNISELKKSPTSIFQQAANAKSGVYIFNRNTPSGVIMSVKDYENMVNNYNKMEEELFDLEASMRLKNSTKTYSDAEVRGNKAMKTKIVLDDNDGWE